VTLAERLLAITAALRGARLPHAFGGAIALAYWTQEPRGTRDLDVNVFVGPEQARAVLDVLGALGVASGPGDAATIARDGQIRLWWDDTPVDLFFDYAEVHHAAARHVRTVPFAGFGIPVLGPVELAIFKAMFDRTKDWADVEAMLVAQTLDADDVHRGLALMLDPDDPRFARLDEAVRQAGRDAHGDG
jgi:hypothetical protein